MLKGNLSSFSLGEIFQSLAVNNHTGTLKISTRSGGQKCIYFSNGEISLFSSGSREALRIGEILIRLGKLTQANLQGALEEQRESGELLGKVLISRKAIGEADLREALETKVREEIYDLFLLTDAEFEFYINHFPEDLFDPLLTNTRIAINTGSVVLEGMRRVDEWRLIQRRIKTFDEIFAVVGPADGSSSSMPLVDEVLSKLDGQTPVWKLFDAFGGSRFECSKTLYELIESGRIRTITVEEGVEGGKKALYGRDLEKALCFLKFADQLHPARIDVLRPLAAVLNGLGREADAEAANIRLLRLYSEQKMSEDVLTLGQTLIGPGRKIDPETAECVFTAALAAGKKEAAVESGELCARLAIERKDFAKAEEVIEKLWAADIKDLNFRIELAEIFSKEGQKERAIAHLGIVAEGLQEEKRIKELIKVLRLVFEIDPQRQDIKHRLQNLLIQQEKIERRKKRRITIVGGAVIGTLLLSMVPLFYELKARELYCHAQRLEEISISSNDFTKVREAYEKLLRLYCFSSRADKARTALERVASLERMRQEASDDEKAKFEKIQEGKLQILREAFPGLLAEAKAHEDAGRLEQAHEVYSRIAMEFAEVPGARNVLFPIRITSSPRGATVEVNGVSLGGTPLILHANKGQELVLNLTRNGCQASQETIVGGVSWKHHFVLNRRPIVELKYSGPIAQPMDAAGGRIFFPSRDGYLYAVIPGKKDPAWQRKVGQFGDLVSEIGSAGGEILLGDACGEVFAISRENGKSRWRSKLKGAVIARPVLSPDGMWVAAATVEGEVAIFAMAGGGPKGLFKAEDEVVGAPAFVGNLLIVGSVDRRLYELEVPSARPRKAVEFSGAIGHALTPWRRYVVFPTSDGKVHAYSPEAGAALWSCSIGAEATGPVVIDEKDRAFAGTSSGRIVAVDLAKGSILWNADVSRGRMSRLYVTGGHIFAGSDMGELVSFDPASGAREWSYKADSPILAPPLAAGGRLYIPCTTGKILVMELGD